MSLAWRLLRSEGPAALRDRLLDRLAGFRRRRAFRPLREDEVPPRVPVLNVLPTAPRPDWGGVQTQLLLRLGAESEHRAWALLYPDARSDGGGGFRLEMRDGDRRRAVRILGKGLAEAVHYASERLGSSIVHVEQCLGFPFAEVVRLADDGRRLVLSVHDFGFFCRRPHLVERPRLRFCDFCRDDARCRACLSRDWQPPDGAQAAWRADAQSLLDAADAVVYPSDYLRRTYTELFRVDPERQYVVAPPATAEPVDPPPLRHRSVRHLAYVGSVQPHKGAHLLVDLIDAMRALGVNGRTGEADLRWTVYGGGDPDLLERLRSIPGVRVRGYYRSGSLPELLRRDGVDLALLLSIWPETYALTLDECRLAGVPVLAFDHGAPGERLRAWKAGWTVDPAGGVDALVAALRIRLRGVGALPEAVNPGDEGQEAHAVQLADARSAATRMREIYAAYSAQST